MNFSLRKVLLEDINELSSMHIQAWKDAYQNIIEPDYLNNLNLQDKISTWQKVLSNEKSGYNLLACNEKNKIHGFASAGVQRDDPSFENNKKAIDIYLKNKCTFANEKKKIMLGNKEYSELLFVWKVESEDFLSTEN